MSPSKREILYIAGPMSGLPDFNYAAFEDARARLKTAGYAVLCPTDVSNDPPGSHAWEYYMRRTLKQVLDADAIATLPDAATSRGAMTEIMVARQLGMNVRSVEWWLKAAIPE